MFLLLFLTGAKTDDEEMTVTRFNRSKIPKANNKKPSSKSDYEYEEDIYDINTMSVTQAVQQSMRK